MTSPTSPSSSTWASRGTSPTRAACIARCTAGSCGRCASTRASRRREESNERYRYLLAQGVDRPVVAFDLPTQMGYDSDDPRCLGEVGRTGVAIDSIDDMRTLFDGIPLDRVSTSMTINAPASSCCRSTSRSARSRASRREQAARHDAERHPQGVHRARHLHLPAAALHARWRPTSSRTAARACPSGTRSRSAATTSARRAATAVQEVAFTLANAIAYVQAAVDAGLDVDDFAPRLSFFFNAHNDFFEEIAKFRAARRLWARLMRDRFGATDPQAQKLRFHTQTGGLHAHRPAARQQRRPRGAAGPGGRARRHAVAAHQRPRRGAGAAHRGRGAPRAADAAGHRLRDRRGQHRRPGRRRLLRRALHRRDRAPARARSSTASTPPAAR